MRLLKGRHCPLATSIACMSDSKPHSRRPRLPGPISAQKMPLSKLGGSPNDDASAYLYHHSQSCPCRRRRARLPASLNSILHRADQESEHAPRLMDLDFLPDMGRMNGRLRWDARTISSRVPTPEATERRPSIRSPKPRASTTSIPKPGSRTSSLESPIIPSIGSTNCCHGNGAQTKLKRS